MQHVPPDISPSSDWTHRLVIELGQHGNNAQLKTHIETFVILFLKDRADVRYVRLGDLEFGLTALSGKAMDFDAFARDIQAQLFGPNDNSRVYIQLRQPRPAASSSLDQFRDDIRTIARSMHGNTDLRETMAAFQAELRSVSSEFREDFAEAINTIQDAAERVEIASALIPDPDRFELLMARNEASTMILERGVRQALEMILEAVDGLAARGVISSRSLPGPEQSGADDDNSDGF